jgi:hypothetical protein
MKKLLLIFFVLVFIGLVPQVTEAGRTRPNLGEGEECECGQSAPPACYDEGTGMLCSLPAWDGYANMEQPTGSGSESLPLLVPFFVFLIWRMRT